MKIIFILIGIFIISGCRKTNHPAGKVLHENKQDVGRSDTRPSVHYFLLPLNDSNKAMIRSIRSADTLNVLCALNRVDRKHLLKLDTLVVPDTFIPDLRMSYLFPDTVPAIVNIHKMILFSYWSQAFAAYEKGILVKCGPVSMGKRSTPTDTGLFYTNWKAKETISTINSEWIMKWYFNLHNSEGISMHEYDLPGYPASHACVRMLSDDARWFYGWADQWMLSDTGITAYGTPVLVFGTYPFGKRKPWLGLPSNNKAVLITEEKVEQNIRPFIPGILERQASRERVMQKMKTEKMVW